LPGALVGCGFGAANQQFPFSGETGDSKNGCTTFVNFLGVIGIILDASFLGSGRQDAWRE
jgi:hypothetical protein